MVQNKNMADLKGTDTGEFFAYKEVKIVRIRQKEVRSIEIMGLPAQPPYTVWIVEVNLTGAKNDWFDVYTSRSESDAKDWMETEILGRKSE